MKKMLLAAALLALTTAQAGGQMPATTALPAGYSLFSSENGDFVFPYPAGWLAMKSPEQYIFANSLDALGMTAQENFTEFAKGDAGAGISVWNTAQFGLKPSPSSAEIATGLYKMMTKAESVKELAPLGVTIHPAKTVMVGGKTFSGVNLDGKMNGFFMAYLYKPGILLTVIHLRQGTHDAALEQKLLWAAAQAEYTGGVPALMKDDE